jgi:DNA mismatch repair protein MutS2
LNANTFRTLEFEAIRALLLGLTGSVPGRARTEALAPLTEPGAVRSALELTGQGVALVEKLGRQPYHDLPDLSEIIPAARVDGLQLDPGDLLDVASFVEGGCEIARRVRTCETAPSLASRAAGVDDSTELATAIRRAILPSREVADDASPRLAELRRSLIRLRSQLHSVMDGFLKDRDSERLLQDKIVTTRNDRFVLIVKAEHRGSLAGIVHGGSGSGASVFVEPLQAVGLNNEIVAVADDEKREVARILRDLTRRVGLHADALEHAGEVLGELDAIQARALLARELDAVAPDITDELDLELFDARHPLLMPHVAERLGLERRTREPVPISLKVGFGRPVLVISGPNTGGKTVALKTLGLLALMAQCGLHVPAGAGSRLPVFRRIFADIGDDQSIAESLSTFSAHLAQIVSMTRDLALPALVLLDEVGAGTDPTEGGGLGVAIVDHFRQRGAMTVATTHHGLMKAYATSTPKVACASFGYDPVSYEPTYRLQLGVPGRSLALEMAERLGLPQQVVHDARSRLDTREAQVEAVLRKLDDDKAALERESERLADARRALEVERERQRAAERALEQKRRTEAEASARNLRKLTEGAARQAADAIARAVDRIEKSRKAPAMAAVEARVEAVREIREATEKAVAELVPQEPELPGAEIAEGSRVRVRSLGVVGEVLHLAGSLVEIGVSGKRLRVPRSELIALGGPGRSSTLQPNPAARLRHAEVPAEINLVGCTVDEALPRIDKLLDDAALGERRELRVIHGFGEGKLKRALSAFLSRHPQVATVHVGAEGGGGVTVVELKD